MSDISPEGELLAPVAASLPVTSNKPRISKITQPLADHTAPEMVTEPVVVVDRSGPVTPTDLPVLAIERRDPVTPTDLPALTLNPPQKQHIEPTTEHVSAIVATSPIRSRTTLRQRIAKHKILSLLLLVLLLAGISVPTVEGVLYGMKAYATYNALRSHAYSGVQHLLNVKSIFIPAKTSSSTTLSSTSKLLNTSTLLQAKKELNAAHSDFAQVRSLIDNTSFIPLVEQYLPHYRPEITSARAASQVGLDVSNIGQTLINTALVLAPNFRGPLLNASQTPLVTSADLTTSRVYY